MKGRFGFQIEAFLYSLLALLRMLHSPEASSNSNSICLPKLQLIAGTNQLSFVHLERSITTNPPLLTGLTIYVAQRRLDIGTKPIGRRLWAN
jgi:hypothetical protein